MSKQHDPDRKQDADWDHDPEDYQDIGNEQDVENLKLWGPEDKSETEYDDLHDQSFQTGKKGTSQKNDADRKQDVDWDHDPEDYQDIENEA